MKTRVPRKLKKACKLGTQTLKQFHKYLKYLKQIGKFNGYNTPKIAMEIQKKLEKLLNTFPVINFASVRDTGESIQGTTI